MSFHNEPDDDTRPSAEDEAKAERKAKREARKTRKSELGESVKGALPAKPKDALPAPLLLDDPVTCIHPASKRVGNGLCTACGGRWK